MLKVATKPSPGPFELFLSGCRALAQDARWLLPAMRVLGAALVLAAASQVRVSFLATMVPFTLQPQAVVLLAAMLGPAEASAALALWLGAGSLGLPVFAGVSHSVLALLGPTAGYLWSYFAVVALVGRLGRGHSFFALAVWMLSGVLLLLGGSAWLALWVGAPAALSAGFVPFVVADAAKLIAVFLGRTLCRRRAH